MIRKIIICLSIVLLSLSSCGRNNGSGNFPSDFNKLSDQKRVAYMMENVSPDSVARFICNAALGKISGVRIDSINEATLYAYENYKDDDLVSFSNEFDKFSANLPLQEKMKLYFLSGKVDPQGMGYQLGLEYVNNIRVKKLSVNDVKAEIAEFKKACGSDTETYRKFVKGFKTVLELDKGVDLPQDIYNSFINLPEE